MLCSLQSRCLSPPGVYMDAGEFNAGGDPFFGLLAVSTVRFACG